MDDDDGKFIELNTKVSREFENLELGKVTFVIKTSEEFFDDPEQGDLLFYPPYLFGELVQKSLIKAIPDYVVESDPYQKSDVYKNQRRIFGVHKKSFYAVSLGVSSFALLVNTDALSENGIAVPTTWSEYQTACLNLATRKKNGELKGVASGKSWSPTVEPTKSNWLAATYMARTGSYIRTRGKYSVMFDYSSWQPLIQNPPFARAMSELIAIYELMDARHQNLSPREVELAFLRGECFMAITWTHPPSLDEPDLSENVSSAIVFPLPGSTQKYDASQKSWSPSNAQEKNVRFLGAGGFCGSVLASSKQSGVATRRLGLLAGKEFSSLIGKVNTHTGAPYRASHVSKLASWISGSYSDKFCQSLATELEKQNQAQLWMIRSRVDQARHYEAALSAAIRNAIKDHSIEDSLERILAAWNKINLGVDTNFQKQISLEGLGVK